MQFVNLNLQFVTLFFFSIGFVKTESDFIVRSIETGLGR